MLHAWPRELIRETDDVLFEGDPKVRFTVIAIHEDRCWIQDRAGRDEIVPLSACALARTFH
jgi:hypothetical protein